MLETEGTEISGHPVPRSSIHLSMSTVRQSTARLFGPPNLKGTGNSPAATRRQTVVLDKPVSFSTSGNRMVFFSVIVLAISASSTRVTIRSIQESDARRALKLSFACASVRSFLLEACALR